MVPFPIMIEIFLAFIKSACVVCVVRAQMRVEKNYFSIVVALVCRVNTTFRMNHHHHCPLAMYRIFLPPFDFTSPSNKLRLRYRSKALLPTNNRGEVVYLRVNKICATEVAIEIIREKDLTNRI